MSLQGKTDILTVTKKVTAFQKKLTLQRRCLEMFPLLCNFIAENDVSFINLSNLYTLRLGNKVS